MVERFSDHWNARKILKDTGFHTIFRLPLYSKRLLEAMSDCQAEEFVQSCTSNRALTGGVLCYVLCGIFCLLLYAMWKNRAFAM